MAPKPKCIIILSTKSAGSSALQELICKFAGGQHVEHTRHKEQETLYWTKAASMLGLPQVKLPDSEVPIPARKAEGQLREFLKANVATLQLPSDPSELVVKGWEALSYRYVPVFVEKSPHHLHQWSCLKLMLDVAARLPDLDFRFVGLVRNPMDVLYSAWTRWRTRPEEFQHHWQTAYENLERLRDTDKRLTIVRYEDFLPDTTTATQLLESLGIPKVQPGADQYMHMKSRSKWKTDKRFGFQLDPGVAAVAERFGYPPATTRNTRQTHWLVSSTISRLGYRATRLPLIQVRRFMRAMKGHSV